MNLYLMINLIAKKYLRLDGVICEPNSMDNHVAQLQFSTVKDILQGCKRKTGIVFWVTAFRSEKVIVIQKHERLVLVMKPK